MNINNIFYTRDQSFAKINLAMNYLSRLVRENMTVFDYDARKGAISFLTDSDKLVSCILEDVKGGVELKDFRLDEAKNIFSNGIIDETVNKCVSEFVKNLHENSYGGAEDSFSNLLETFESRSRVNEARAKLERRRSRFGESQNIKDTPQFEKLMEVKENIVTFLKENKDTLLQFEDVVNSVKLTNALGKAFNLPVKTWEDLMEMKSFSVPYDTKKTVFEMICTQELIRTELVESKENFSKTWINNPKIAKLASCIYSDTEVVEEALREAIQNVPYLALASKLDIKTVFASIYETSDVSNISQKDIREFVSRIFEAKKSIKQDILKELSDSYGINVQNLKFIPTFSNLAKAQSVLFEALARISDKESVVKDVFSDFATVLRKKSGIQTLDVNEFINAAFSSAGINDEHTLFKDVDLEVVAEKVAKKDKFPEDKEDKFGGNKGDDSKTHKGKDFEKGKKSKKGKNGDDKFDGDKGDDSKITPGEEDFDEKDEKGMKGKKGKNGKNGKNGNGKESPQEKDDMDDMAYDEAVQGEPKDDVEDLSGDIGDEGMVSLMGELESLFKEVDWSAIADEENGDEEVEGSELEDAATNRSFEEEEESEGGEWSEDNSVTDNTNDY